jgi:hypothetical protein
VSEDEAHAREGDDQYEGGGQVEADAAASSDRDDVFVPRGPVQDGFFVGIVRGRFHGLLLGESWVTTSIMGANFEDDLGRQ